MFKKSNNEKINRRKRKVNFRELGIIIFLTIISIGIVMGYFWLFAGSFSGELVYGIFPKSFTLKNWRFLWENPFPENPDWPSIWPILLNTLYLGLGVTIIVVSVSTLAAYVISRMKFPGRSFLLASTLILHAFPAITLLIALYYILKTLNLLDTITGVVLAKAGFFIPFGIWIMKGFFDGISWDMEMSALIDGATRFQAWHKVMLPIVKPGIAAISIFSFLMGWSEYIFVITFNRSYSSWTLTSYISAILSDYRFSDYGLLAAVSLFYMVPVILFFIFTQKYLMKITLGGMKGGR
ncbi:MAG TPA: carbohydrate ABC transporter permease [Candidatus Atribacteria bacterium]|jgi:inositol-phosphate transport system permease protein|nr:carbohydrate ABC transporter permease [Candidatus Atribacteria bacterium]